MWVVEGEVSSRLEKKRSRKKKKRRKKKEVCPVGPGVDIYQLDYFALPALGSVPCLLQLPKTKGVTSSSSQVLNDVLSPRPGTVQQEDPCSSAAWEHCVGYRQSSAQNLLSHPFCPDNSPREEVGPRSGAWLFAGPQQPLHHSDFFQHPARSVDSDSRFLGNRPYRLQTRGVVGGLPPIHSRINLMDAELLDADSDF